MEVDWKRYRESNKIAVAKYKKKNRSKIRKRALIHYYKNRIAKLEKAKLLRIKWMENPTYRKRMALKSAAYRKEHPIRTKRIARKAVYKSRYGELGKLRMALEDLRKELS